MATKGDHLMKKFLVVFIILSLLIGTTISVTATTVYSTWFHTSQGMEDAESVYPDTTSFVFSPNYASDHTVYAGTYNGVYKSTDSGSTWASTSSGLDNDHVNSLAISPNYASDHSLAAGTGGGVYLSNDYGANWTDISGALPDKTIEVVVFHPSYNYSTLPDLFVGTSTNGVYITTTNSWNWHALNTGLGDQRVRALVFTPDYASNPNGYLYAGVDWSGGTAGGVFKIKKGNTSWTTLNNGLPTTVPAHLVVDALAISPNFAADQTIFAGIGAGQGVYRSTDGGANWNFLEDTTSLYIQSLAISPYYPCDRTIFAGEDGGGVYVSRDTGASWNQMNTGFDSGKSILSLIIAPGKSNPALTLFAGTFGDGAWQYLYPHNCMYLPLIKR